MKNLHAFLNDEMEDEEMEQFAKEIIYQKFDEDNRAEISQILAKDYGVERNKNTNRRFRLTPLYRVIAIAASLALLIGLFFYLRDINTPKYEQLADAYIKELPIMSDQLVARKDDTNVEEIRLKANEAYIEKEFEKAVGYFNQLQDQGDINTYDQFYLGLSYLRKEAAEPQRTIALLTQVQSAIPAFQQEINWVLSLAYLKNEQEQEAVKLLQSIVAQQAYMHKSAKQLLEAIND
jgi:hypothetical protein